MDPQKSANLLCQTIRAWKGNQIYLQSIPLPKGGFRQELRHSVHNWRNPHKGRVAKGYTKAMKEVDGFDALMRLCGYDL